MWDSIPVEVRVGLVERYYYVGLYSSGGEVRASGEVLCMWDSIPVEMRVGLVERYYVCGTLFQWR